MMMSQYLTMYLEEIQMNESAAKSRESRILEGMAIWASFYRCNPHRFAKDYLNLNLKLFQKILLFMMNICNYFCYIAARGQGKSFLIAIFCCVRCILYPGTKICIASGTRGQSINILEKIKNEIMPNSENLRNEILNVQISSTKANIDFKNGSVIKVVTASDTARGNRANILICDEFRMIDADTISTVLKKFLTAPRMPGYLHNPEYAHLSERNKEIYLSSAFFKSHWCFSKVTDFFKNMLDEKKKYFVCGLPYQLSIKEGLLSKDAVMDEMSEAGFNEIKWSMEMDALFFGDDGGTFFEFENISKNRRLSYPMLPDDLSAKISDKKIKIQPKQNGEKRILSADIALMSSNKNKNDASAIFINQCIPQKNNRYVNNIIYTESSEGLHTEDQALRIRRLFEEYMCDYIVLDVKGVGFGVYDALIRDMTDPDTGEIYPAISCCNNSELASRCVSKNADKVIWAINGSSKFNSDCALFLREGFRSGKIRLLVTEYDGEELLGSLKGYQSLSVNDKMFFQLPYINTTLLINELIHLQHEESGGLIKISEKNGMRKDRYSSLSYNYYVACQLESSIQKTNNDFSVSDIFMYRAPKIK